MRGSGKSILVVDDEPSIRFLCRINLELDGYTVLEAGTLDEARELLERHEVDAMLLDVHVGGERGYDVLRELRDAENALPVALLTGSETQERVEAALADAVLRKPFTLEELQGTVRALAHDVDACNR